MMKTVNPGLFGAIFGVLFCLTIALKAPGQDWDASENYLQGYAREIHGLTLKYHAPHPDVNAALLVRSLDEKFYIAWETEPVPSGYIDDVVTFIWMFGLDVNDDSHSFDLFINDEHYLRFANPETPEQKNWTIAGKDGSELQLRVTLIDRYDDFMGYAILKVPRKIARPGKPLVLKVVGETANSNSWYMTFKSPVKKEIDIRQQDRVLRKNTERYQSASVQIVHLGDPVRGQIAIGSSRQEVIIEPGFNRIPITLPVTESPKNYLATIKIANRPEITRTFVLEPVRKWTIYLVTHSHTDIGYTRPQTEILPEHLRFIDYALDFCDRTDHYPDAARFRWTCESSWPVREYLNSRPSEQIARLQQRVAEGRIELTGMFFNMSEIIDEAGLAALVQPIKVIKAHGMTVTTAMQNDVNGIGWCLVDYFHDIGLEYVIMGEHGHRALLPFDKPTAFWWESPSGKRVLAYRPDHYMTGNLLGIHTGNINTFEAGIFKYLKELSAKHYPYNEVSFQYSGYMTDNSPPALKECDLIKDWNEKYEWPKLRNATAREFMDHIRQHYAGDLPVLRAAWPDWWTDGFGSAALETGMARMTQADLLATQGLLAMAELKGAPRVPEIQQDLEAIQDALLFYDEHTFGAAESISDPMALNSVIQWGEKSAYVWEAVKKSGMVREKALGALQSFLPRAKVPTLTIFNTLNWSRSDLAQIYIDHEILPKDKKFKLVDDQGNEAFARPLSSRDDGTCWGIWAANVPAFGYKSYRIQVFNEQMESEPKTAITDLMENPFYKLIIDQGTGAVKSLYDKELKQELIDKDCPWQLSQLIYEQLSNRWQIEQFKLVETPGRTSLAKAKIDPVTFGPIWQSLIVSGLLPGCADERGVQCEIRLYHHAKRIEFCYSMHKLPVRSPEAAYVAFPFTLPQAQLIFEAQGGTVVPGKDQLAGTASDWNTVQNFVAVRNPESQIVFCPREIPLVHLGGLNIGRFDYISRPGNSHIFSWVLNNYWTTNFKASQEGELQWSYCITSTHDPSNGFATRFGWSQRVPLLVRVLPAGSETGVTAPESLITLDVPNLLLIQSKPATGGPGVVLHLREINGTACELSLDRISKNTRIKSISEVNVLEEQIKDLPSKFSIKPFEIKFVKIRCEQDF